MKTHKELMDEAVAEIHKKADQIAEDSDEVHEALKAMLPGRPGPSESIALSISREGMRNLRAMAGVWRVSRPRAVRMILADAMIKLGFNATGVANRGDLATLRRHPEVEQPLVNYEESMRRRKIRHNGRFSSIQDLCGDDPSQSPRVHESGGDEPSTNGDG